MELVDSQRALKLLNQAIAVKGGNYRYLDDHDFCVNFEVEVEGATTIKPACIVGHVFDALGLTYRDCQNWSVQTSVSIIHEGGRFRFTVAAVAVLAAAQGTQDAGGTWGEAHRSAYAVADALDNAGIDLDERVFGADELTGSTL